MPRIQVSVGKSQSAVVVRQLATGQMWLDRWGALKHAFHPHPYFPANWTELKWSKCLQVTRTHCNVDESPCDTCQYSRLLMAHLYSIDWIQAYKFTQSSQICTCVPIPASPPPHPPPFSINFIRVCIYCGNASGPSAGDKRNIKWFPHWFTWEKYTIWKPVLIILISIEKKDTSENKTESFGNCWQVICLQVRDEVQKIHANNCSVNLNLWIKFIIDIQVGKG